MEWFRVEDRLPKEARLEVLVTNGHSVAPAWWVGGRFEAFCANGLVLKWVTHWAKFPDPPDASHRAFSAIGGAS
jgi:Protein of unknown function (DUF551)